MKGMSELTSAHAHELVSVVRSCGDLCEAISAERNKTIGRGQRGCAPRAKAHIYQAPRSLLLISVIIVSCGILKVARVGKPAEHRVLLSVARASLRSWGGSVLATLILSAGPDCAFAPRQMHSIPATPCSVNSIEASRLRFKNGKQKTLGFGESAILTH